MPISSVPTAAASAVRDVVDNPNDLPTAGYGDWGGTQMLFNAITSFGTPNDPSWMNRWLPQRMLQRKELFALGRNALSFRAINLLGATATSEGWKIVVEDDRVPDKIALAKQVTAYETRLGILAKCARAICRGRQYGDAIVLLGIDDSKDGTIDFSKPVDPYGICSIRWAVVIDRRDFSYYKLAGSNSTSFSEVETYQITDINGVLEDGVRHGPNSISYAGNDLTDAMQRGSGQLLVHASRVLSFRTVDGYSTLDTLQDSLAAYIEAAGGIRTAARESSVVKYKISQLMKKGWNENAGLAYSHMSMVDRAKSLYNAWVLDKDHEDVESLNRNLSGVEGLTNPFMVWLAAALGVPVTVFWGVSPGGFGKGEAERETWHESVYSFQTTTLEPQLTKLHSYILAAWDGPRLSPNLARRIEFADLSPPDESKRSELRSRAIDDFAKLKREDILTRDEIRASLPRDEFFSPVLSTDQEEDAGLGPMQVGAIAGTVAIMQAAYPAGVPIQSARALQRQVDPQRFTPEIVAEMYPEVPTQQPAASAPGETAPTPAQAPASASGPVDPLAPNKVDTTPEAVEEQDEVEVAWSRDPMPTDALEAAAIAKLPEINVPTVRITNAIKAGKLRAWRVFGGKPRVSLRDVKAVLISENAMAPVETPPTSTSIPAEGGVADAATPVRDWDEKSFCVVLRCPDAIAVQCPYKPKEPSPPHVTFVYVDDVYPSECAALVDELRALFAEITPFGITLTGAVDYFDDPERTYYDSRRVAYAVTQFDIDVQALFAEVAEVVESFGLTVSRHGDGFVPHVTLAYLSTGEETYDGRVPEGTWQATEATAMHDGECYSLPLSCNALWVAGVRDMSEAAKAERIAEAYKSYHEAVNMGAAELRAWAKSKWSIKASVSRAPIERNLLLLETPREKWTLAHASSALRTVNFVARMRGNAKGEPVKIDGREGPSRRDISLKNWAFDPSK